MSKTFCSMRATASLVCILLVHGCGNTPANVIETDVESTANHYIGSHPIYAYLEQERGGNWMLTTVTDSDSPPDKGYLLRLNDLAPSFDVRIAECEAQAYPGNHKCSPTHPFREKQIGVMDRIINGGVAAGTAGTVTEISRTYETVFNNADFNQAVDEALINTGLGVNRREFLNALERYDTMLESARAELAASQEKALARYHNTGDLILNIRPHITGLTSYYSGDIVFRDIVLIEPLTAATAKSDLIKRQEILPCEANRCATKAQSTVGNLQRSIDYQKSHLVASLEEETSAYALQCDATTYAGYSFSMECPATVSIAAAGSEIIPVTLDIQSRDFDAVYPEVGISDENLSVTVEGDHVIFTNHTSDYLSVDAQSVYYNSHVQTLSEAIDIAPGVDVERPIDEFVTPAIRVEASHRQMTPDKAKRTSIQFGFAARYRLAGSSDETTLFDSQDFSVGCIIDNRIRPNSCPHASTENAPGTAEEKQRERRAQPVAQSDKRRGY